jgi:hypothetical protein
MKKLSKMFLIIGFIMFLVVTPSLAAVQYDYVTYYMLTSEEITLAWDDTNAGIIIFDVHIERVEWDEVVTKYTDITTTECTITLPRAGLYIFMVRSKRALTESEITNVNGMDRAALLQFIQDNNIVDIVGDTTDLTDQEIKDAVILAGKASTWAKSTTHGQVEGVDRGWWVYGYIAKPGPIVIGNVIKYYSHNKVL